LEGREGEGVNERRKIGKFKKERVRCKSLFQKVL